MIFTNFTDTEKQNILNKTKGRCAHCGKKINIDTMVVTSVYPNNDNSEYNVVAVCKDCIPEDNKVYAIEYFKNIINKELNKYSYNLLHNIYSEVTNENIFGNKDRYVYYLNQAYAQKVNNNKKLSKNKSGIVNSLAKKVLFKILNKDDITAELVNMIKHDSVEENIEINIEYLYKLMEKSTLYGMYYNDDIVGIIGITNIKNVKLHNEKILETIDFYKETYIVTLLNTKAKYDGICQNIHDMVSEFMTMSGCLVMYSQSDLTLASTNKLKGIPCSMYEAVEGENLFKDKDYARALVVTLGEAHETVTEKAKQFEKKVNQWKSEFDN